eukprot:6175581-Pleurochrysis_carterae.AAC.1
MHTRGSTGQTEVHNGVDGQIRSRSTSVFCLPLSLLALTLSRPHATSLCSFFLTVLARSPPFPSRAHSRAHSRSHSPAHSPSHSPAYSRSCPQLHSRSRSFTRSLPRSLPLPIPRLSARCACIHISALVFVQSASPLVHHIDLSIYSLARLLAGAVSRVRERVVDPRADLMMPVVRVRVAVALRLGGAGALGVASPAPEEEVCDEYQQESHRHHRQHNGDGERALGESLLYRRRRWRQRGWRRRVEPLFDDDWVTFEA